MLTTGMQLDSAAKQRALRRRLADAPHRRPRLRHRLRPRASCPRRCSTRRASAASRCSRCPTRCRSSRSPRRRSPRSSTSSTRCCSGRSPSSAGWSGCVLEERGLDEIVARDRRRDRRRGGGARRARRGARLARSSGASSPAEAIEAIRAEARERAAARRAARSCPTHPDARPAARSPCRCSPGGAAARRRGSSRSRDVGGLGDFERLIARSRRSMVVALELMRQRVDARDRAPARRRRAGRGARRASSTPPSSPAGCGRSAIGGEAAVLVFALERPAGRGGRRWTARSRPSRPRRARRRTVASRSCSARSSTRADRDPIDARAARARERARRAARRRRAPRPAARRRPTALRRSFHEARCALEAAALAATATAPEVASYRDLGAFQLLLSLQDDDALRLYCDSVLGPIENGERRVRRRAAALARGVHRAERPVGAGGARAVLPPPHAALPDPAGSRS